MAAQESEVQSREGETIVKYPAGLGTSVAANFNSSANNNNITSATSNSVTFSGGTVNQALTLGVATGSNNLVAQNGVLSNGSTTADANLYLTIPGSSVTSQTGTLTLTANSTRPQSVWYTVSASGTLLNGGSTLTTQKTYDLTTDETNNIFAVSSGKIAGAGNNANGNDKGYTVTGYSTAVGGTSVVQGSNTAFPVATPSANGLQTNNTTNTESAARTDGTTITINQNYLPLGITSAVKDAYFNHNGII